MNGNVGENIQGVAKVVGWIFLIAGVIMAIVRWDETDKILPGLIPLLIGVGGNVSCWVLYGFGYLIEVVRGLDITLDSIKYELKEKK